MKKLTFTLLLTLTMVGTTMSAPGPHYTMDMHRYGLTNASLVQGVTGRFDVGFITSTNAVNSETLDGQDWTYASNTFFTKQLSSNTFILRSGDTVEGNLYIGVTGGDVGRTLSVVRTHYASRSGDNIDAVQYLDDSGSMVLTNTVNVFDGYVGYSRLLVGLPTIPNHATTKAYVDSSVTGSVVDAKYVQKAGDTMSGALWNKKASLGIRSEASLFAEDSTEYFSGLLAIYSNSASSAGGAYAIGAKYVYGLTIDPIPLGQVELGAYVINEAYMCTGLAHFAVQNPASNYHAATKGYVDSCTNGVLSTTKSYVDSRTNFYGVGFRSGQYEGQIWCSAGYSRVWVFGAVTNWQ